MTIDEKALALMRANPNLVSGDTVVGILMLRGMTREDAEARVLQLCACSAVICFFQRVHGTYANGGTAGAERVLAGFRAGEFK